MTARSIRRKSLATLAGAALVLTGLATVVTEPAAATVTTPSVGGLQVENVTDPLGVATATPRLSWQATAYAAGSSQQRVEIRVATTQAALTAQPLWDSTITTPATTASYGGPSLQSGERYYWQARIEDSNDTWSPWSGVAFWQTGQLLDADWHGAAWIGPAACGSCTGAPDLRTTFTLPQTQAGISWATLSVAALGMADASVNGAAVDADQMDAAYTDYTKRILYVTHNVNPASLVSGGSNAIGVVIGNGWYNTPQRDKWTTSTEPNGTASAPWRGPLMARVLLTVRYSDGSTQRVVSAADGSWTTDPSETTWDAPYGGESVDLRTAQPGWDTPGFDATSWSAVQTLTPPADAVLAPQIMPAMQKSDPVSIVGQPTNPAPGVYVYKLAANTTGWAKITMTGSSGQVVSIDYDETLGVDGKVSKQLDTATADAQHRWQHDEFTLDGNADSLEPRFTYKGFGYLQISSPQLTAAPPISSITVYPVHTALATSGSFTSDDQFLNLLHAVDTRTLLNNVQGIETDTPHRERMGWLGDLQLASANGMANFDSAAFYESLLADMRDGQQANGLIPPFVPTAGFDTDGTDADPWWGGAIITVAWNLFRADGDVTALAQNYAAMAGYLGYLDSQKNSAGLVWSNLSDYDSRDPSSKFFVGTAAYYMYERIMSSVAIVLGNTSDAASYSAAAAATRNALNARYFANGVYHDTSYAPGHVTQTGLSLALALGLTPDGYQDAVTAQLLQQLQTDGRQLTTGIVGTKYVLRALDLTGHDDIAYDLAAFASGAGYAAMLNPDPTTGIAPATTMWEQWDATAHSQDSPAMTSVDGWMYQAVAGIQTDPYATTAAITIAPNPVGTTSSADGSVRTPTGTLDSSWQLDRSAWRFTETVTVPMGTTVTVSLPYADASSVTDNGAPVAATQSGTRAVITPVGPGTHVFVSAYHSPNLALNAPVTSSSSIEGSGWGQAQLTDGRDVSWTTPALSASRFPLLGYSSAAGNTNPNRTEWVQVDLGSRKLVNAVTLFPSEPATDVAGRFPGWGFPVTFTIQVSDDPAFAPSSSITTFLDASNVANPGATPQTYGGGAYGRYVRLSATTLGATGSGQYALSLAQLAVNGAASNTDVSAPERFAFGGVPVGTSSAAQTITVTNTGQSAMQMLVVDGLQGTPFVLDKSGTCHVGATVQPGASCTFVMIARPTVTGPASATLDFEFTNQPDIYLEATVAALPAIRGTATATPRPAHPIVRSGGAPAIRVGLP